MLEKGKIFVNKNNREDYISGEEKKASNTQTISNVRLETEAWDMTRSAIQ